MVHRFVILRPMAVLEVKNVRKKYRDLEAVEGVSFSVEKGEIVGLLGPNGAGKTTTINMILGVLEPTGGAIMIDTVDVARHRSRALEKTNFAAVYAHLPGNLTVSQNLWIFGLLYDVANLRERTEIVLKEFELEPFARTRAGALSSGEQTRLSLAKAMLNEPTLLLLDEPTASLDPSTARIVREKIREYAAEAKAGILWTSHNMQEVTQVCDRVLFLSHGKILLEGDPKTLPEVHGKKDLEDLFITIAREPLSLDI